MKFNKETVTTLKEPGNTMPVNAPSTAHNSNDWETATQLGVGITAINSPGGNDYSVQLPAAVAGSFVILFPVGDFGENTVLVWPKFGTLDTINGTNSDPIDYTASGSPSTILIFACDTDGAWVCNGSLD